MTIENQQSRVVYTANGTSTAYTVPFPFLDARHLVVNVGTGALGSTDQTLVYATDYTVTGAGAATGGKVTMTEAVAAGKKIAIRRTVPMTQISLYPEHDPFPAKSHEAALDKLTMIVQDLKDVAEQSTFLPPSSTGDAREVAAWMEKQVKDAEGWSQTSKDWSDVSKGWADTSKGHATNSATSAAASAASAAAAKSSETKSAAYAGQAKADADRAARLVDPATLASSVFNVRKAQVLAYGDTGQIVNLLGYYYPCRDVLYLSYNGTVCTPIKPGVEPTGDYQYEEVGNDPNVESNQVKLHFATQAGDVLDMFVVASAAGRNLEQIEAMVSEAAALAQVARASQENAAQSAESARAAADTLPDINTASAGDTITAEVGPGGAMVFRLQPPSAGAPPQRVDIELAAPIAAGSAFTVPQYTVGGKRLTVYLDGVLCAAGAAGLYLETGTAGSKSTTITLNDALDAGHDITAIVAG